MIPALNNFVEDFKFCPLCHSKILIDVKRADRSQSYHQFSTTQNNNQAVIKIESDYYFNNNSKTIFNIYINNGNITYDYTAAGFLSIYGLDIVLEKHCENCFVNDAAFYRSIKISFNKDKNIFDVDPNSESFGFSYNNIYYFFTNDYINNISTLSSQSYYGGNHPIKVPFIPFNKFDFSNREKLFAKINAITLLI